MMEEQQTGNPKPMNDLDFNMQMTQPKWGHKVSTGFMQRMGEETKVSRIALVLQEDIEEKKITEEYAQELYNKLGELITSDEATAWNVLAFYTQDMRLGNLEPDEIEYCAEHLNFAGDCLQMGLKDSFLLIIQRVATTLELSQSKKGFLRRRMGTLTNENINNNLEPKKKSFFGMNKGGD